MEQLKKTAEFILSSLKAAGADDAQVSVADGYVEEFNVDAGEFSLIRSVFSSSASMKVIKDGKKGTCSVNQLDSDSLGQAVADCISSAVSGVEDDAVSIAAPEKNEDFTDGSLVPDKAAFFDSVIKYIDDIGKEFPEIMMEQLIATYSYGKNVVANTNGVLFTEEDGSYNVSVMYSAHRGEESTSFNGFEFDFTDPNSDLMELGDSRTMFRRAVNELETRPFDGKFSGTAVIAPSCMGDFVNIIMGSFCGDYAMIEGTSPWKNSLGEKVADECFSLSVIPHDERTVCGEKITADGYRSENYDVIENGILKSFCISEYASRKTGLARSKSTSGCVEIKKGEKPLDEIISGIENGVLVCRFSGGEPASNGDFSGVAKNSFLIKDGKISYPISETMISGNFAAMLKNIQGISSETVSDGACVLPYIAFGGVTVSGADSETEDE